MGIFGENKLEVLDKRLNELDNRELSNNKLSHGELIKFKQDVWETFKEYDIKIATLNEILQKLLEEKEQINKEELTDNQVSNDGLYSIRAVCKEIPIQGLNSTVLKYYLYENNVYDMKINELRNCFNLKIKSNDELTSELKDCIHIKDNSIEFNKEFLSYCDKNKGEILSSIERYNNKQEQYKKSKKKLESRNVENYREEIKAICGTDSNERWIAIYKVFSKTYRNFYDNCEAYKKEHGYISRVQYVVSIMGQGNFLLKIACDLYA